MIKKIVINETLNISNDGSSTFWFKSIEGLSAPERRDTVITYSDRNGGDVPKQLEEIRTIQVEGGIDANSCDNHLAARAELIDAIGIDEWRPVDFYLDNGNVVRVNCKFRAPTMPIEARIFTDFMLFMYCKNNEFDGLVNDGELNVIEVREAVAKGWTQHHSRGWIQHATRGWIQDAGIGVVNAFNAGTTRAYPIIKIVGEVQNPIVYNQTTGELFKVNITTGSDSDVIEINTRMQYTKLNGGNINALVDTTSTYFTLAPGDNIMSFNSDAGDGYATVSWLPSYRGL